MLRAQNPRQEKQAASASRSERSGAWRGKSGRIRRAGDNGLPNTAPGTMGNHTARAWREQPGGFLCGQRGKTILVTIRPCGARFVSRIPAVRNKNISVLSTVLFRQLSMGQRPFRRRPRIFVSGDDQPRHGSAGARERLCLLFIKTPCCMKITMSAAFRAPE